MTRMPIRPPISPFQAPSPGAFAPVAPPEPPAPPVILETAGYQLRSLRPHDASPTLQEWLSDPDMLWGLNLGAKEWPLDKMKAFILSFDNRKRYLIGIFDKSTRAPIGFYLIDANAMHRSAHISVGIGDREYWGRNVLIETTPVLLDHLFMIRSVEKVSARIISTNRRILFNFMNSKRFFFEGKLTGELRSPSGERLDVLSFAALKGRSAAP